jgi:hypothetical protein
MASSYLLINEHLVVYQDKEFVSILALISFSNKNAFCTDCLIVFISVTPIIPVRIDSNLTLL